jgi:type IV pilus assembly protein PilB
MPLGKVQSLIVAKLIAMGRLTTDQRDAIAARPQDLNGDALDRLLQDDYKITAFQCLVAKGRALGLAPFNVARYKIASSTFERIPQEFCQENLVLPVGQVGDLLLVAFANPVRGHGPAKIQEMTGKRVVRLLGREKDIREKFNKNQQVEASSTMSSSRSAPNSERQRGVRPDHPARQPHHRGRLFAGASDIHIEPWEKELIVRYRIDGICQEKLRLPAKVAGALVARLKIMCNLDIAERRLPQDGRIVFKQYTKKEHRHRPARLHRAAESRRRRGHAYSRQAEEHAAAARARFLRGEPRQVPRVHPPALRHDPALRPDRLGQVDDALLGAQRDQHARRRHPTAEDPIEYTLAGINQMQMHRQIGLTFAAALRCFLRQDPDIILVGEIRDKETADIAVEAALTGHLAHLHAAHQRRALARSRA